VKSRPLGCDLNRGASSERAGMVGVEGSHRWRPVRSIANSDVFSQTGAYVVFFAEGHF
jgi:hypothetical protein